MKKSYSILFSVSLLVLIAWISSSCNSGGNKSATASIDSSAASAENKKSLDSATVEDETGPGSNHDTIPAKISTQEKKSKIESGTFKGQMLVTRPYCGGAAPSKEILEEAKLPRPLANEKFYLRQGKNNTSTPAVINFTTDAKGNFSINLPPGNWCLIAREQNLSPVLHQELYKHPAMITNDKDYKKWWNDCRFELDIKVNETVEKTLTFSANCMTNSVSPFIINPDSRRRP